MQNQTIPVVNELKVQAPVAEAIVALENLIKSKVESIGKLSDELKKKNEMFVDSFNNNPTFRDHNEKVKEATRARMSVKSEISKMPDVARLKKEVEDMRFDIKKKKKELSDFLLDYKTKTAATQLELFNGEVVNLVETVKIVKVKKVFKKNKRFKPKG